MTPDHYGFVHCLCGFHTHNTDELTEHIERQHELGNGDEHEALS